MSTGVYAQTGSIFMGELVAWRVAETVELPSSATVDVLTLDAKPGWTAYSLRKGGGLINVYARITHNDNWVCGVGVPTPIKGVPVTRFSTVPCGVFYAMVEQLNKAAGRDFPVDPPPSDISRL